MILPVWRVKRGVGLRTQILLMLMGAAILPLALVGVWLTSSAERSGEELLRSHLNESLNRFVAAVEKRWDYRRSDIALIAENEAAVRAVSGSPLNDQDRSYLNSLGLGLAATIPVIELRDMAGTTRWESSPATRAAVERARGGSVLEPATSIPATRVESPIIGANGTRVGTAVADAAISGLVPPDSARPLVPGARVSVRNSTSRSLLLPQEPGGRFPEGERDRIGDASWLIVHRSVAGPALDIAIAAPLAPYVEPFAHAATIGVVALAAVALLAIVLTALLATRATRPLWELAAASDAVTHGRLDRRVSVGGPAEVRNVGAAFNVMTENLQTTLDTLSRRSALAAVGEFATSLSHDVRNALTAIKVDLERTAIRDLSDPVADGLVNRAINNVARLENTVSAALRVARRGQAPPADIDLRAAIEAAVDTVRGTFASVPATVIAELPSEPVVVCGDAGALEQLFANLLFNAAQALSPGGEVRVALDVTGAVVDVTVFDNGRGISAAEMADLETPFYSSKPNGTGFGLPIARQIVAGHGGELLIESEVGSGTKVRIRLPRVNGSYTSVAQSVPETEEPGLPGFSHKT